MGSLFLLTDELDLEHGTTTGANRVPRLCRIADIHASHHKERSKLRVTSGIRRGSVSDSTR